jgi:hypothetical protein
VFRTLKFFSRHRLESPSSERTRKRLLSRSVGCTWSETGKNVGRTSSALFAALVMLFVSSSADAQPEGQAAAERLQQGKEGKNKYRSAAQVPDMNAVIKNMEKLFEPILIQNRDDGGKDEWYEAHLRDAQFDIPNRVLEAVEVRGQTNPLGRTMGDYCTNPLSPKKQAACPLRPPNGVEICTWHGERFSAHRPLASCYSPATTKYKELTNDTDFKVCCVRRDDRTKTSEEIAIKYPRGDGWAGLFEYYYPTAALGWENDRTTTMIVDKRKVDKCIEKADPLMENETAQKWVAEAIERNLTTGSNGEGKGKAAEIQQQIAQDIKDVRPEDKELRFADSLQSEGLTLRVNLAAMQEKMRRAFSERICGRPEQLDKLMDPSEDLLQKEGSGGATVQQLDANIPVWASYCPQGVELMTDPKKSLQCVNPDLPVKTDLQKGTQVWENDPLYCQSMNLQNINMQITRFDKAIREHSKGQYTPDQVGYTCLVPQANLNAGMAPVTLVRQAAVERRTAITDHAIGFMIAGAIAPGMITGQRSYYKRFEPQAYSQEAPFEYQTFIGKPVKGGGTNELGQPCPAYNGKGLFMKNKSDRLYISNATHAPFTQQIIDESNDINKYVQDWSDQQKEKISNRGLDEKSQNYAAAFRIFATCPKGFVRWEPPWDRHNEWLRKNIEKYCRWENFGGVDTK